MYMNNNIPEHAIPAFLRFATEEIESLRANLEGYNQLLTLFNPRSGQTIDTIRSRATGRTRGNTRRELNDIMRIRDKILKTRKSASNYSSYVKKKANKSNLPAFYNNNGHIKKNLMSKLTVEDIISFNNVPINSAYVIVGDHHPRLYAKNSLTTLIGSSIKNGKSPVNPINRSHFIKSVIPLPSEIKDYIKRNHKLTNMLASHYSRKKAQPKLPNIKKKATQLNIKRFKKNNPNWSKNKTNKQILSRIEATKRANAANRRAK